MPEEISEYQQNGLNPTKVKHILADLPNSITELSPEEFQSNLERIKARSRMIKSQEHGWVYKSSDIDVLDLLKLAKLILQVNYLSKRQLERRWGVDRRFYRLIEKAREDHGLFSFEKRCQESHGNSSSGRKFDPWNYGLDARWGEDEFLRDK